MEQRWPLFILTLLCGLWWVVIPPSVRAQPGTAASVLQDQTSITTGGTGNSPETDGYGPGFGSIGNPKTVDGYTIVGFYDVVRFSSKGGGYQGTKLTISGFSSDPGRTWLGTAVAGNVTFTGSAAIGYAYSAGQVTWTFAGGPAFVTKPSPVAITITHGAHVADLNTKFKILGVDYAPPGARSSVNYGNTTVRGTGTSNAATWTSSTTVSVQVSAGLNFLGLAHGTATAGFSNMWSQESDTSSSVAINTTTNNGDIVFGPASSAAGVDHDYDVIWVWLNPMVTLAVGPNTVVNTGYAWNASDDAGEMEVVPLYVYNLKNPATIDPFTAARLARSWDTALGGLTNADYALILAADPFAVSPSYNPNTDPSHRFDLEGGQTFSYEPPPPGGQPITQTFSVSSTTTSQAGQGASNSTSTTYSLDFNTGADVIVDLGLDVKIANTYGNTDKWTSTVTTGAGQSATLSITGPQTSDNYMGPTTIQVWRDNVYGSFMFYPLH